MGNTKSASAMGISHQTGPSRILSLPPEIRNLIYRHALVESSPILIPPSTRPPPAPGLLQACSQTRQEATGIYYRENTFIWMIVSMDASLFINWSDSSPDRRRSNMRYRFGAGKPIWENVLHWIEAVYHNHAGSMSYQDGPGVAHANAVAKMVQVMKKLKTKGCEWEEIKEYLECMRQALAAVNADWR